MPWKEPHVMNLYQTDYLSMISSNAAAKAP